MKRLQKSDKLALLKTQGTSKKVKVVGKKEYIDVETGEVRELHEVSIEDADFNFEKVWLTHLAHAIDLISNQKIKVLVTLWKLKDYNNKITISQTDLAKKAGVSYQTVNITIRSLVDANILQMLYPSVYRINPQVVFKGSHNQRMAVLLDYKLSETTQNNDEEVFSDPDKLTA